MTATQEGVSDQEAIVRAAVANLVGHSAFDARDVEATVRRLVAEWLELARVKTFVGIIAERHARMELSRLWSNTNRGPEPDAAATENS